MDTLIALGVFAGKAFIIVLAVAVILTLLVATILRARQSRPAIHVENLNEKFENLGQALKGAVLDRKAAKRDLKAQKKRDKAKKGHDDQKRIFVLDFHGDIRASHVENLREEVTALLTIARPGQDEVVVRLESRGGLVPPYGLAAAQLLRLRQAQLHLTICVDTVAASGGYMMACTANRIVVAPFAILGSVGVVAQVPNFHRLLKKHDVDYEELTAGDFKRTVSVFGEITERGRAKFMEQIEDTHFLFKEFVKTHRPQVDLTRIATGEYWYGRKALDLHLADEISSSDDLLFRARDHARIFHVEISTPKKLSEKIAENLSEALARAVEKLTTRFTSY